MIVMELGLRGNAEGLYSFSLGVDGLRVPCSYSPPLKVLTALMLLTRKLAELTLLSPGTKWSTARKVVPEYQPARPLTIKLHMELNRKKHSGVIAVFRITSPYGCIIAGPY